MKRYKVTVDKYDDRDNADTEPFFKEYFDDIKDATEEFDTYSLAEADADAEAYINGLMKASRSELLTVRLWVLVEEPDCAFYRPIRTKTVIP